MNNNINSVRGITIIGIMYIHTISFLVDYNSLSYIVRFIFSLASLCVPLLFMISGYLFKRSRNQKRNTKKTILLYVKLVIIVLFINQFILHVDFDIYKFFLFNQSSIGYLWFIKVLIYFQLIILCIHESISGLLFIGLLFIASTVASMRVELLFYATAYYIGYYIGIDKYNIFKYVPKYFGLFVFTMPIMFHLQYYSFSIQLLLMSIIAFCSLLKMKSNYEIKLLTYFSNNGLTYLCFQYLTIELLLRTEIEFTNFWLTFLTVLSLTTVFVLLYDFFEKRVREERLKS